MDSLFSLVQSLSTPMDISFSIIESPPTNLPTQRTPFPEFTTLFGVNSIISIPLHQLPRSALAATFVLSYSVHPFVS